MKTFLPTALFVVAATIQPASFAQAQDDAGRPLIVSSPATTVQLPTFNFFTVQTTVLVPDRGNMPLGGVNSAASRSHTNGIPGFANTGRSSTIAGGNGSVGVQIVDLQELDRSLRGQAAPSPDFAAANAWATRLEQARQSSAGRPTVSVAEARRLRAAGEAR